MESSSGLSGYGFHPQPRCDLLYVQYEYRELYLEDPSLSSGVELLRKEALLELAVSPLIRRSRFVSAGFCRLHLSLHPVSVSMFMFLSLLTL